MLVWAALLDVCLISACSCCSRDLRDEGSANASPGVISPPPVAHPGTVPTTVSTPCSPIVLLQLLDFLPQLLVLG